MHINDKDFIIDKELEERAQKIMEDISEIKSVPFPTETELRADRLVKSFNLFKLLIEDMKAKGELLEIGNDDKKKVDKIISMMREILDYIESGKME